MKIKGVFVYTALLLLSIFSFFIPSIYSLFENEKVFEQNYIVKWDQTKLSEQNRRVELLNTIYSKYDNNRNYNVSRTDTYDSVSAHIKMSDEKISVSEESGPLYSAQQLVQLGIINGSFYEDILKEKDVVYQEWTYNNQEASYSQIKIFVSSDSFKNAVCSIEIEHNKNKVINITLKNNHISSSEELLWKYKEYLELNQFTDWEFTNNELSSLTGQVKITAEQNGEYSSIKIVPINYNS